MTDFGSIPEPLAKELAKLLEIIEDPQTENPQAALHAIELACRTLWKDR